LSVGYHRAGFDVVGVDIRPYLRRAYPFTFVCGDALALLPDLVERYRPAAVHASPPCQAYTRGAARWGTRHTHPALIKPTRVALETTGLPFVIENVEEAAPELINPVTVCGTTFGLGVLRHRLFELNGFEADSVPCHHDGRIGDGRYFTVTGHPGGRSTRDGIQVGSLADWRQAMGIDWMSARQLAQAIPPAYTEHIGGQLLAHLGAVAA